MTSIAQNIRNWKWLILRVKSTRWLKSKTRFVFVILCLFVSQSVCFCQYSYTSICLSVYLSPSLCVSVHLSVGQSMSVHLSVCQSISVHLSVCQSVSWQLRLCVLWFDSQQLLSFLFPLFSPRNIYINHFSSSLCKVFSIFCKHLFCDYPLIQNLCSFFHAHYLAGVL